MHAARELQKEEQQAKEASIALKAEEMLQRQLQKEEKRRLDAGQATETERS